MTRTYVVTGVAGGIGAEIARQLSARGDRVIGLDRHETHDNLAAFVPLDLQDEARIDAAVEALDGPFDGLVNNAGLPPRDGLEDAILQVNFLGQRRFTQALLPRLSEGAAIVNMASRAGAKWPQNVAQNLALAALDGPDAVPDFVAAEGIDPVRAYDLSKEAMILWTMAMTDDLIARGLRANSVSPGAIATGILDDFARAFGDRMARNVARAGRPGRAEEVAALAVFLLSPESGWIKGVDVPIDGGMGAFNAADALGLAGMRG